MEKPSIHRKEVKRAWWYRFFRSINWFCYQYWWFVLVLFLSFLLCWYLFCFKSSSLNTNSCANYDELNQRISSVNSAIDNCCDCKTIGNSETTTPEIGEINDRRDSLGGKTGLITITLAWSTLDDLDLYLIEPNGNVIFFKNKISSSGGKLDIDMNANEHDLSTQPIENIYFTNQPPKGTYKIKVHFYKRNTNYREIPYVVYLKIGDKELTFQRAHSKKQTFDSIYEFTY